MASYETAEKEHLINHLKQTITRWGDSQRDKETDNIFLKLTTWGIVCNLNKYEKGLVDADKCENASNDLVGLKFKYFLITLMSSITGFMAFKHYCYKKARPVSPIGGILCSAMGLPLGYVLCKPFTMQYAQKYQVEEFINNDYMEYLDNRFQFSILPQDD